MNKVERRSYVSGVLLCCFVVILADAKQVSEGLPAPYAALFESGGPAAKKLSPDQKWLLIAQSSQFSKGTLSPQNYLRAVGKKLSRLSPVEIDTPLYKSLTVIDLDGDVKVRELTVPNAELVDISWSPDSKRVALVAKRGVTLELWRYELDDDALTKWSTTKLSAQFSSNTVAWLPDSRHVVVRASLASLPDRETDAPQKPLVKDTEKVTKSRVYRDLLDTETRRSAFKKLTLQQAVLVDLEGTATPLSQPSMLEEISISPDGRFLLSRQLHERLDHNVKFDRLARRYEVIDVDTQKIVATPPVLEPAHLLAKYKDAAAEGARLLSWLPSQPSSLVWVEAIDGGDTGVTTEYRDQVKIWPAPFQTNSKILIKSDWRIFQLYFTRRGRLVFSDWRARDKQFRLRNWHILSPQLPARLIRQYTYTDSYADPGDISYERTPLGYSQAVSSKADDIYFFGAGQNSNGRQPFVTKCGNDLLLTELFRSNLDKLQEPLFVLNNLSSETLLIISETRAEPPTLRKWSNNQVSKPFFTWRFAGVDEDVVTQHLSFSRADGVELSGELYLPSANDKQKLPVVIWWYPREYEQLESQRRESTDQRYIGIDPRSPLVALLEGIAVFDASFSPIVKQDSRKPNDTFLEQQQANATAVLKALDDTGKIDVSRALLMGHSYGAFGVVSLLANTDLFRAGIARSGAYNRTLTPLGFQGEERTLWQAPELYTNFSPIYQADRINEPLLLIHGDADKNPGTAPLQSELLFEALQANGSVARLLLLPGEGHEYKRMDSLTAMLQQQRDWFNRWLLQ